MTAEAAMRRARAILWLDGASGLGAGVAVLLLHRWLATLHEVEPGVMLAVGVVNVLYGCYSGTLATLATRRGRIPARLAVTLLVLANLGWTGICAVLLATVGRHASGLFYLHVGFEGLYVAALAGAEWRWVRPAAR